jgi:hypothetical protein
VIQQIVVILRYSGIFPLIFGIIIIIALAPFASFTPKKPRHCVALLCFFLTNLETNITKKWGTWSNSKTGLCFSYPAGLFPAYHFGFVLAFASRTTWHMALHSTGFHLASSFVAPLFFDEVGI